MFGQAGNPLPLNLLTVISHLECNAGLTMHLAEEPL
jgi:hypothetical protein